MTLLFLIKLYTFLMKHIFEYLSAKVKNLKFYDVCTPKILEYFGIGEKTPYYNKIFDYIYKWCEENNIVDIDKLHPICNKEVFDLLKGNEDFKKVESDFMLNKWDNQQCMSELMDKHTNKIKIDNSLSFYFSENMIAMDSNYVGMIFCWYE